MLASTWRLSSSVFATSRWMAPAPRSKPSSTTYTVSMMATSQNQVIPMPSSCVSIRGNDMGGFRIQASPGFGSELNLAIDEEEPEDRLQSVHAHKADQC